MALGKEIIHFVIQTSRPEFNILSFRYSKPYLKLRIMEQEMDKGMSAEKNSSTLFCLGGMDKGNSGKEGIPSFPRSI